MGEPILRKDPHPEITASREGRVFKAYVNDDTALNAERTVITDAGAWVEIGAGKRYFVTAIYYTLTSASDTVTFEIVTTDQPAAAGAVTVQTVRFFGASGAANDGIFNGPIMLPQPLCFTDADGQTIAMRLQTNDADADVNAGFFGWWEWES